MQLNYFEEIIKYRGVKFNDVERACIVECLESAGRARAERAVKRGAVLHDNGAFFMHASLPDK